MGSSDCFCAICGGPFREINVCRKPRTARFLGKMAEKFGKDKQGKEHEYKEKHGGGDDGDDDDANSLDSYEEDNSYDPTVITEEDVKWAETLHVLAFNPDSEQACKSFVSGPGTYDDVGFVNVEDGDDPNVVGLDLAELCCYDNWNRPGEPIFPFHWCCYEILAKCLAGSFGDDKPDKDLLFTIMRELSPRFGYALSKFDYGVVDKMQDQSWNAVPGFEFVVSHPRNVPGASEVALSMFGTDAFKPVLVWTDLGSRVRHDPYAKIPYDVLYRVSGFISDEDLINLARASWPVLALLRNNNQFWRQRLRDSFFPWYFELRELLEQDETVLRENDAQRIFQWAEKTTRPERWLTGPLMGVANRRRIWSLCEQFGRIYWPRKEDDLNPAMSDAEKLIRKYSKCGPLVTVSAPEAIKTCTVRKVYWAKAWSEIQDTTKTLESFWDSDGSLVGLSLTPDGEERRLLGRAGSDDGTVRHSKSLAVEEWITDIIVHIPVPVHLNDLQAMTSPKGLTMILNSGKRLEMGETTQIHMQRFLSAAPKWVITGITGTTGDVMGKLQLTQLGLVQAQQPDVADYSMMPYRTRLPRRPLQEFLWEEEYSHILGQSIREHPGLRLVGGGLLKSQGYLHRDLIMHGALIWAKDVGELRALRRLSACIVFGGKAMDRSEGGYPLPRDIHHLCGMSAEYEPASGLARRTIGLEGAVPRAGLKCADRYEHFDIDGPGGEVVTEVEVSLSLHPRAIKIHTNRGRTFYGGETGYQHWESIKKGLGYRKSSLRVPDGETLVGVVMASKDPGFYGSDGDEAVTHYKMSAVAGLSMRLEASTDELTPV